MGYGYSTNSNFTPASGWTSTGTASASASGSMSNSFTASSPYAMDYNDDIGETATMSGPVTGSGGDSGQIQLQPDGRPLVRRHVERDQRQRRGLRRRTYTWGYFGTGTYSQTSSGNYGGSTSESGSGTYTMGYEPASGSISAEAGGWTQSSGSGDASGTADFSYSFSGDASGSGNGTYGYNDPLDVTLSGGNWSLAGEGTVYPSNTTTSTPTAAVYTDVIDNVVNTPEGGYVVDVPSNPYDAGDPYNSAQPGGSRRGGADHVGLGTPVGDALAGVRAGPAAPVSSLPSLATSASLVDAIWGMGSVADPGYRGMNVSAVANDLVDTLIAAGNSPSLLPAFVSEKMPSADGVFGTVNVADVVPVTDVVHIVNSGSKDVPAAGQPAAGSDSLRRRRSTGPNPSVNPLTNVLKPSNQNGTGQGIAAATGSMQRIASPACCKRRKAAWG